MQPSLEQSSSGAAEQTLGGVPERPSTEQPAAAPPQQNVPEPPSTPTLKNQVWESCVETGQVGLIILLITDFTETERHSEKKRRKKIDLIL